MVLKIVRLADRPSDFVFFVSFGRTIAEHEFDEGITEDGVLSWQSQPSQRLDSPMIGEFIAHDERRSNIHLFLRTSTSTSQPYTYLGRLKYLRHDEEREQPVYFQWQILDWDPTPGTLDRMGLILEPRREEAVSPDGETDQIPKIVEPPARSDPESGVGVATRR